jgi:hypothetical protein
MTPAIAAATPWTTPSPALARARPPHRLANACPRERPRRRRAGRHESETATHRGAPRGRWHPQAGWRGLDTIGSNELREASMPVDAVSAGGRSWVSSGSTIASRASMRGLRRLTLMPSPGDASTALRVTSDPVPAVVGTAMKGTDVAASGCPAPSPRRTRGITRVRKEAAVAFRDAITLPPPTESTASALHARAAAVACRASSSVGSWWTRNRPTIPAASGSR